MSESNTLKLIMLSFKQGRLLRNNQGIATYKNGQKVKYGVGHGGSDLIGWTIIGDKAVFTAVEVKRENWTYNPCDKRERQQKAFIDAVASSGGIAGFVTSVFEFEELIKSFVDKPNDRVYSG